MILDHTENKGKMRERSRAARLPQPGRFHRAFMNQKHLTPLKGRGGQGDLRENGTQGKHTRDVGERVSGVCELQRSLCYAVLV